MSKHTPGPWKTRNLKRSIEVFSPSAGRKVASVPVPQFVDGQQSIDNARLIAAAWDLLQALEGAALVVGHTLADDHPLNVKIRAAIAKATGNAE